MKKDDHRYIKLRELWNIYAHSPLPDNFVPLDCKQADSFAKGEDFLMDVLPYQSRSGFAVRVYVPRDFEKDGE